MGDWCIIDEQGQETTWLTAAKQNEKIKDIDATDCLSQTAHKSSKLITLPELDSIAVPLPTTTVDDDDEYKIRTMSSPTRIHKDFVTVTKGSRSRSLHAFNERKRSELERVYAMSKESAFSVLHDDDNNDDEHDHGREDERSDNNEDEEEEEESTPKQDKECSNYNSDVGVVHNSGKTDETDEYNRTEAEVDNEMSLSSSHQSSNNTNNNNNHKHQKQQQQTKRRRGRGRRRSKAASSTQQKLMQQSESSTMNHTVVQTGSGYENHPSLTLTVELFVIYVVGVLGGWALWNASQK